MQKKDLHANMDADKAAEELKKALEATPEWKGWGETCKVYKEAARRN